jgi:hypothetical protein
MFHPSQLGKVALKLVQERPWASLKIAQPSFERPYMSQSNE